MTMSKKKLTELLRKQDFCMLTTVAKNGRLMSRPMSMQQAEFDGDLWFLIYDNSTKAKEVEANPQVNVSFSQDHLWISLTGKAEILHDKKKEKELWSPFHKAWFPDGLETPHLALLKVTAESAEYWETSSNVAVQLFGVAKAAITGKESDVGENKSVKLKK